MKTFTGQLKKKKNRLPLGGKGVESPPPGIWQYLGSVDLPKSHRRL